ncbi:T3SS (YopN, CesT) and YbjN peptide-binding chaperone 1 [Haliangium sp.]|uniref:T3SS (YopN, CesT) and YbjN peptide-binding chaperone 1 n=1 Tax=Haliangium sp. TaxID=2663208 RepID=UPI003D0DB7ED
MNPAEIATALLIEETLGHHPAYRKVEDRLYVVRQGSAYVMINIVAVESERAMVRCVAQLVKGIEMTGDLALQLLTLNTRLRFGAFAYEPVDKIVLFIHSILGGSTLDAEELTATLRDVALIADEYDDKLVDQYGGQRMSDLIEEAAMERIIDLDSDAFQFRNAD